MVSGSFFTFVQKTPTNQPTKTKPNHTRTHKQKPKPKQPTKQKPTHRQQQQQQTLEDHITELLPGSHWYSYFLKMQQIPVPVLVPPHAIHALSPHYEAFVAGYMLYAFTFVASTWILLVPYCYFCFRCRLSPCCFCPVRIFILLSLYLVFYYFCRLFLKITQNECSVLAT